MNQFNYLREWMCMLIAVSLFSIPSTHAFTTSSTDDLVAPIAIGVDFTEFPDAYQLYPRNVFTNKATVSISGEVQIWSGYDQVRVKVYKNNSLENTFDQTLSFTGGDANFSFNIQIDAELADRRFDFFGVDNSTETLENTADNVVAGDLIVINGQSNALAGASIHFTDNDPFLRSFTTAAGWVTINQTFPGQWGGRLGKELIDSKGIPVAIINEAVGGQQITYFLKNDANPSAGNYGDLKTRLEAANLQDDIRAFIWFQGEQDSWVVSTEDYKTDFYDLYNDWKSDYTVEEFYLFQVRYQSCSSTSADILEAHRQLANEIGDLDIMSTNNTNHDGCHYPYYGGYETLGDRMYGLLNRDLYGGSGTNVTAPNVVAANVSGDNEIIVEMDGTTSLSVSGSPWSDFEVVGNSSTVSGGFVSGNDIHLQISGGTAGATGISYLGHPGNTSGWVNNATGIGILSFQDFPLGNTNPGGGDPDCDDVMVMAGTDQVMVEGLAGAPIVQLQVFNASWSLIYSCSNSCNAMGNC